MNSKITYTGNGSSTSFVSPIFDANISVINVYLDHVYTTEWSFNTDKTVVIFNVAPANGVTIDLFRETSIDQKVVEFSSDSLLNSPNLNLANSQLINKMQELEDLSTLVSSRDLITINQEVWTVPSIVPAYYDLQAITYTSGDVVAGKLLEVYINGVRSYNNFEYTEERTSEDTMSETCTRVTFINNSIAAGDVVLFIADSYKSGLSYFGKSGLHSYFHTIWASGYSNAPNLNDTSTIPQLGYNWFGCYSDRNYDALPAYDGAWNWQYLRGSDGINGTNGVSSYIHIAYANDTNGTGFNFGPPTSSNMYMGTYSSTSPTASTNYTSYTWSLIQGPAVIDDATRSGLLSFFATRGLATTLVGSNYIFTGILGANTIIGNDFYVNAGHIGAAAVDTLQVAGDAITLPITVGEGPLTSIETWGTDYTLQSITLTSAQVANVGKFFVFAGVWGSGYTQAWLQHPNGSTIGFPFWFGSEWSGTLAQGAATLSGIDVTPTAGTYYVRAKRASTQGSGYNAKAYMCFLGCKR